MTFYYKHLYSSHKIFSLVGVLSEFQWGTVSQPGWLSKAQWQYVPYSATPTSTELAEHCSPSRCSGLCTGAGGDGTHLLYLSEIFLLIPANECEKLHDFLMSFVQQNWPQLCVIVVMQWMFCVRRLAAWHWNSHLPQSSWKKDLSHRAALGTEVLKKEWIRDLFSW